MSVRKLKSFELKYPKAIQDEIQLKERKLVEEERQAEERKTKETWYKKELAKEIKLKKERAKSMVEIGEV